ncbi:MAG: UvrB/UvrC motif-containing protein [Abditibacteriales bacterium]|nr:UvrB/UvrC motif-containing protein [Abditibacteriales bacterium]MDW8367777.1 UvrB/UvrC motif-containing protein [Abditibacteriales bacterium]
MNHRSDAAMWCDECHVQPANVFLKKIVNHQVTEVKLCEQCARHSDITAPLFEGIPPLQELIESFLTEVQTSPSAFPEIAAEADAVCPRCGLTYDELRETERVGCATCYETFRATLDKAIRQMHSDQGHAGKVPAAAPKDAVADELQALQAALSEAVAAERYEEAARLRDRIRSLKGKM